MTVEAAASGLNIRDKRVPAAPLLLSPSAAEFVAAAVEVDGGTITRLEPTQVLYSPRRAIALNFDVTVSWPDRAPSEEVIAAVARRSGLPEGALVATHGDAAAAVWRFPADPKLPGMDRAMNVELLSRLLGRMGLEPGEVDVTPLVYRPIRRGVVRLGLHDDRLVFNPQTKRLKVDRTTRDLYLKVFRPGDAAEIRRVHDSLRGVLPVPRCYACWDELGLLLLEGLPGMTLRDYIRKRSGPPPDAEEYLALLDALRAATPPEGVSVRRMDRRVKSHARLLKAVLPEHAERVERVSSSIVRELVPQPVDMMHADFYDGQILVGERAEITGLLDLDGVGPGERIDDLASLLGRVWTSGQEDGRARERFADYGGQLLDGFSRVVDRRQLCLRVAGIVFGRATGPFRSQSRAWAEKALHRLDLAERCLQYARRAELPVGT